MAESNPTTRRYPDWFRRGADLALLTPARLAEMRVEALECDEHNRRAYAALVAAFEAYAAAARAFGMEFRTVARGGRPHVPKPVAPSDTCLLSIEAHERRYAEHVQEQARRKAEAERLAERARSERAADLELAKLIVRYEARATVTGWDDMLDLLCSRDKYLDLAVAGYQTRGDWSDGFYRVSAALERFKIESDQDKEIVTDLSGCCMSFDDGRVFRDTTWSYDELFKLVKDQQLVPDAKLCLEHL